MADEIDSLGNAVNNPSQHNLRARRQNGHEQVPTDVKRPVTPSGPPRIATAGQEQDQTDVKRPVTPSGPPRIATANKLEEMEYFVNEFNRCIDEYKNFRAQLDEENNDEHVDDNDKNDKNVRAESNQNEGREYSFIVLQTLIICIASGLLLFGYQQVVQETSRQADEIQDMRKVIQNLVPRTISYAEQSNQEGSSQHSTNLTVTMKDIPNGVVPKNLFRMKFDDESPALPRLKTGREIRMAGYDKVFIDHDGIQTRTGVFSIPDRGTYRFMVEIKQSGEGKLDCYLRDNTGRREAMTKMEKEQKSVIGIKTDWDCETGTKVWVEVVRKDGPVEVENCEFLAQLLVTPNKA